MQVEKQGVESRLDRLVAFLTARLDQQGIDANAFFNEFDISTQLAPDEKEALERKMLERALQESVTDTGERPRRAGQSGLRIREGYVPPPPPEPEGSGKKLEVPKRKPSKFRGDAGASGAP